MKKIRIKLVHFDHQVLEKAASRILKGVQPTGAVVRGPVPLPTKKEIFTVLRSPHVNKDSREQFMQTTHKRLLDIDLPPLASKTIDVLTTMDLPTGVDVTIEDIKK